jgi:penicillin-binding protein 1A
MAELHYVTPAAASAAKRAPLELRRGNFYSQKREDFFFEYVHQQLLHRYGRHTVEQGGLKVYTTLDLHMQEFAHDAIAEVLDEPEDPASAIVTIDPHNGYIEAMAESESYEQSQYNLASEGHRQPGSTFKAIDLAEALSRGVDPNSTYYLSHTLPKGWLAAEPNYEVHTFEGTSLNRSLNLVQATLESDNTVYAQLAADLGQSTITEMAYKLGVKTHLNSYPAEAIGGLEIGVTPLEMADVYATLADGGWRNKPIAITKVRFPDGRVDSSWGKPHRVKVLGDGVTAEETDILHQNVLGGTAVRSAIECPTAAKTGTTSELVDAWLDGYTPDYSTVVWMGYPNRRVPMTSVHGEPQQGGALPAQIWHNYMSRVVGTNCVEFPKPTEPISYQPFFGRFATTGQASAPEPEITETPPVKTGHGQGKGQAGGSPTGAAEPGGAGPTGAGGPPGQAEPHGHGHAEAAEPPGAGPTGTPDNAAEEHAHGGGPKSGGTAGGTAPPG